jgi:hypothetical protein
MDRMTRLYKYGTNKLALRALVDQARQKVWRDATGAPWFDEGAAKSWMSDHRIDGQSETSWNLRSRALDAIHPTWRDMLGLDRDMFATIDAPEHEKDVLVIEFADEEMEAAVKAVDPGLVGMYKSVLEFVRDGVAMGPNGARGTRISLGSIESPGPCREDVFAVFQIQERS